MSAYDKETTLVNEWLEQEGLTQPNVKNLAKLCRQLGYKPIGYASAEGDPMGHIEAFLEDNYGAIETLFDWIEENAGEEWKDALNVKEEE